MPDPRSIRDLHRQIADLLAELELGETGGDRSRNPEIIGEIARLAGQVRHRKLGSEQLKILRTIGRPGCFLVSGSRASDSLIRRGLAAAHYEDRHCVGITAEGLRALADHADRGFLRLDPERKSKHGDCET